MIFSALIWLASKMIDFISMYGPKWSIWPDVVKDGISYVTGTLAGLNFILPVDTFFDCLIFLLIFDASAIVVVLLFKFIPFQKIL